MKNMFLIFILLWFSSGVNAHGFDYSVMVLTEKENNTWNLHLTSSLDAFRKEVKIHFSDSPYKSPEEFNEQLLKHINRTLKLSVAGKPITLGKGKVQLGHETSIAFKAITIPEVIMVSEVAMVSEVVTVSEILKGPEVVTIPESEKMGSTSPPKTLMASNTLLKKEKVTSIKLTNGAVKDIYRHTTKLFVKRKGEDKKSFILNKSNHFTVDIPIL